MTRLSLYEDLAFTTVRMDCENDSGALSIGTGFIFYFDRAPHQKRIPVIVTNYHVVERMTRAKFQLTRAAAKWSPDIGQFTTQPVDFDQNPWFRHPDPTVDLAALPLSILVNQAQSAGDLFYFYGLDKSVIPTPAELVALDALEEVIMIGYPRGLWDKRNNMPIFRRGVTATHPVLDYDGRKEFVIDAACFPGSSGSPVLICDKGNYTDKYGCLMVGNDRLLLLGVLYAGPQYTVQGEIEIHPIPTSSQLVPVARIPMNLGFVIKAERILEFGPMFAEMS